MTSTLAADQGSVELSYPRLAARTRNFTFGAPRSVSISADGRRVIFLRSSGPTDPVHALWVLDEADGGERLVADPRAILGRGEEELPPKERALRERRRESSSGIVSYGVDESGDRVVFTLSGRLFRADVRSGTVDELPLAAPALDPRLSPAGDAVAYVADGALHVLGPDGLDRTLAADDGVTWGLAEFVAAEEMSRFRGYWWSPDGSRILATRVDESAVPVWHLADPADPAAPPVVVRYPYAGAANADVTLHVLALADGGRRELSWDRATYPYLVTAGWDDAGCALFTVMDRSQSRALVLGADPVTGEVTTHLADAAQPWLEVLPGTPEVLGDGRLVWSSNDGDARRLTVGGVPVTPAGLYVRACLGRAGDDLVVEATEDAPEQNHLYRIGLAGPDGPTVDRLTDASGWYGAVVNGGTTVEVRRSLGEFGTTFTVTLPDGTRRTLGSHAATPRQVPAPVLSRVTERRLPTGVVYPTGHSPGTRLPVLLDPYGGPHHQEVVAARGIWLEPQWWADQGFAVVVIDGRGTPGVAPSFEHAVRHDVAGPVLADQVDGLYALAADHPDLDLGRVGIRGWSFGGYLAALAVLRRPDVFHAGVAGAPVVDWGLYDTFYTERYLGLPTEEPEAYARSGLLADAAAPADPCRPLMVIHGLADDNVVAAHTLRLSSAFLAAGRPHEVLPLTGVTHMATGDVVAENLLLLQRDFLRRALS